MCAYSQYDKVIACPKCGSHRWKMRSFTGSVAELMCKVCGVKWVQDGKNEDSFYIVRFDDMDDNCGRLADFLSDYAPTYFLVPNPRIETGVNLIAEEKGCKVEMTRGENG